jgi:hypothetical protein
MMVNIKDWPTKEPAAKRLGITTRTLARMVASGKIDQRMRRQDIGNPVAVYNPDDLEKIAAARAAAIAIPEVTAEPETPLPAIARDPAVGMEAFSGALAQALVAPKLSEKRWLTLPEASAYSGLGKSRLRELMRDGGLRTERGPRGSVVLNRTDLERLG